MQERAGGAIFVVAAVTLPCPALSCLALPAGANAVLVPSRYWEKGDPVRRDAHSEFGASSNQVCVC
ncbi:hypothetical protein LZ31DRAFT_555282 [Colletotrichum somersetense]|nr:hypothetical protein LZ31DRAFT_555282 [Colletotrichum somersetense]